MKNSNAKDTFLTLKFYSYFILRISAYIKVKGKVMRKKLHTKRKILIKLGLFLYIKRECINVPAF